ncbi:MAG: preprotein translocase subunit YajC [Planctomycetaceae bacterium]|jgi:preprotein translocase subunit YajC|nr:preprotein translocase subunit YajC [Planctomycetaceae bacterium]
MICTFDICTFTLFAQDAPAAAPQAAPGGLDWLLYMLPVFLVFYWFFMLRPQQKQEDKHRKMIASLEKNVKVMTVGGIIGAVHSVDKEQNEVVLKVDDTNNIKMRFALTAILSVFPKDTPKDNNDSNSK